MATTDDLVGHVLVEEEEEEEKQERMKIQQPYKNNTPLPKQTQDCPYLKRIKQGGWRWSRVKAFKRL